ncbi:hypothetical protein C7212DRAFT_208873 [Tuber magnatum]|uniref:HTH CENPB-type domain-containing protein n=1 Tax=Tuber magnatum TaxID=42249 RepID=A0A317SJU2_9PEZI|nr:hypothetical protein C7212DRAFT_208873 [Tuber magnatum]
MFSLNKTTLINRYENCTKNPHHAHQSQQRFTEEEEDRIVQWIIELDDMGMASREHFVRELMLGIMQDRGDRAGT